MTHKGLCYVPLALKFHNLGITARGQTDPRPLITKRGLNNSCDNEYIMETERIIIFTYTVNYSQSQVRVF